MGTRRLVVRKNGVDVSDDIKLGDGAANPFGWSSYPLIHIERHGMAEVETQFGYLYCGEPDQLIEGYEAEVVEDGK